MANEIQQPAPPVQTVFVAKAINILTFGPQLVAAGVQDSVTFTAAGVLYPANLSAATIAKIQAVIAAHNASLIDLGAYTTAAHMALRDGGVTLGAMRVKTDVESRGLIDGAYALSQAQPDRAIDFKAASGWVTVDAATMQTMAVAIGNWVQACYSMYRKVDAQVADGTITTTAQIDAAFASVTLPG